MARHKTHHRFPRDRRVTRLNVIVDQACVAPWSVETLSQVFKEDRHKHCTDREPNQCQPIACGRLVGHILRWACVRHHCTSYPFELPCQFTTGKEDWKS